MKARSLNPLPRAKQRGIDDNYVLWWVRSSKSASDNESPYNDKLYESRSKGCDIVLSAKLPRDSMGRETETITLEEWKKQQ